MLTGSSVRKVDFSDGEDTLCMCIGTDLISESSKFAGQRLDAVKEHIMYWLIQAINQTDRQTLTNSDKD